MKTFAESFYKSKAWQTTRREYAESKHNLCELCLSKGKYTIGEIVHHKTHITPENIANPSITLSFDNLQLVCRECHSAEHHERERRYEIDELGRVEIPPLPSEKNFS